MSSYDPEEALPIWLQMIRKAIDDQKVTHESLVPVLDVTTRGAVGHYLNNRRELSIKQLIALTQSLNLDIREVTGLQQEAQEPSRAHTTSKPAQLSRIYQDLSTIEQNFVRRWEQNDRSPDAVSHLLAAKVAINSLLQLLSE